MDQLRNKISQHNTQSASLIPSPHPLSSSQALTLIQFYEENASLPITNFFESLKELDFPIETLRSLLEIPEQTPYHRLVLYRSYRIEVVLARWQPNRFCAAHDHGGGWGWVKVLEGNIINQECRPFTGHPCESFTLRRQVIEKNDWIVSPPRSIHFMNAGDEAASALTLHFYHGATSSMRIYDYPRGLSVLLPEDTGAWFPGGKHVSA